MTPQQEPSAKQGPALPAPTALLPLALWWPAIRPKTLSLAAVPVFVGTALAWSDGASGDVAVFALTLLTALLIQAGTNLFNDAKDAESGNDGPDRLGPLRVTGSGLASAGQVRRSAAACFALAFASGMILVAVGGLPIVLIGLSALIAGWAYSGGPRPLSHTAWGEVFVVAYFGLAAVSGSYLLQAGVFSPASLVVGLALGLHAAAVLTLNNIRDLEADARAGRRTLAQVLGRPAALRAYRFLMLAPFPLLCITPGAAAMGMAWLALPLAVWLAWLGPRLHDGPSMNRQLAFTALAQVLLGGLLGLNLLLRVT